MVQLGTHSGLHCIWFIMGGSFSNVSKHIKERAVIEFLMHDSETSIDIHECLLAYYSEDTVDMSAVHCWVRK